MNADARGLSEADRSYVAECLGRSPQGLVGVAARDVRGKPSVIINAPLLQENSQWQPFPTLYWLVDPARNKRLAEIERKGGVREMEADLLADPQLMAAHLEDNAAYAEARWQMLTPELRQAAQEAGLVDVLKNSGIGGVANHAGIKCLHAQYAYHLARKCTDETGTTVGRLMEERFGILFEL